MSTTALPAPVRARRAGFLRDVMTVAGRGLRSIPRDIETIIPALVIPVFFFVVNVAKVPTYAALGLLSGETLMTTLVFLPVVPLGAALGLWMHRRVPERPFVAIMYVGAALAGVRMLMR